jgi:hypothetical protein
MTRLEDLPRDPAHPTKHIDPATGIWPISEWGGECQRGFVHSERFATRNDRVFSKRKSRPKRRQKATR